MYKVQQCGHFQIQYFLSLILCTICKMSLTWKKRKTYIIGLKLNPNQQATNNMAIVVTIYSFWSLKPVLHNTILFLRKDSKHKGFFYRQENVVKECNFTLVFYTTDHHRPPPKLLFEEELPNYIQHDEWAPNGNFPNHTSQLSLSSGGSGSFFIEGPLIGNHLLSSTSIHERS